MIKGNNSGTYLLPFIVGICAYIVHKILDVFMLESSCGKAYFLESSYFFFLIFSLLIIFGLSKVKTSNIDYVGYAFLLLTCIKMAAAYALFNVSIATDLAGRAACKMNFFATFIIFLGIETYATIKLLNSK